VGPVSELDDEVEVDDERHVGVGVAFPQLVDVVVSLSVNSRITIS